MPRQASPRKGSALAKALSRAGGAELPPMGSWQAQAGPVSVASRIGCLQASTDRASLARPETRGRAWAHLSFAWSVSVLLLIRSLLAWLAVPVLLLARWLSAYMVGAGLYLLAWYGLAWLHCVHCSVYAGLIRLFPNECIGWTCSISTG